MWPSWTTILIVIAIVAILVLVLIRIWFTRAPSFVRYSKYWWDQSLLADVFWFGLFEIIVTACVGGDERRKSLFVRLFAGIVALIFLYEFIVPVLFPVSTIPIPKSLHFTDR